MSIARGTVLIGVVLLLGVSLTVYAMDATSAVSNTFTQASGSTTSSTTSVPSQASGTAGGLALTNPEEGETLILGENYTISGNVPQPEALPDHVLIQVSQEGSLASLASGYVVVQANGSFSYSMVLRTTWPCGTYVITATDSYGSTGSVSVAVTYGDVWSC